MGVLVSGLICSNGNWCTASWRHLGQIACDTLTISNCMALVAMAFAGNFVTCWEIINYDMFIYLKLMACFC